MDAAQVRQQGAILNGKYRVERVIGEGGMGFVVAALHLGLDEVVALKFLHPECADDDLIVTRFKREAQNACKIKSNHVVRILDVDTLDTGAPFMVMEYLQGEDLAQLVSSRGAFPVGEAVDHILEACDALVLAHQLGIVHRDLKPSNLFVAEREDGTKCLKVLDFGISKATKGTLEESFRLTKKQEIFGSPMYMSPEQLESAADVDSRGDVWSLGVILYELIAGAPPFQASSLAMLCARILQSDAPSVRKPRPEVPEELDSAIQRCLQKDREKRWSSAAEFARAVAPFGTRSTETAPVASFRNPTPVEVQPLAETHPAVAAATSLPTSTIGIPRSKTRLAVAVAAFAVLALVVVSGVLALRADQGTPLPATAVQSTDPLSRESAMPSVLPPSTPTASSAVVVLEPSSASAAPAQSPPVPRPGTQPLASPPPKRSASLPAPARTKDKGLELFNDSQ